MKSTKITPEILKQAETLRAIFTNAHIREEFEAMLAQSEGMGGIMIPPPGTEQLPLREQKEAALVLALYIEHCKKLVPPKKAFKLAVADFEKLSEKDLHKLLRKRWLSEERHL